MIDFTIGLAKDRKEELVEYISSKLREKGYPPIDVKEHKNTTGLVYWTLKTDKHIPRKTIDETIKEIMDELDQTKKVIDPRISINTL
jgi:ribosomal protein S3